jgi:hypothetical protein
VAQKDAIKLVKDDGKGSNRERHMHSSNLFTISFAPFSASKSHPEAPPEPVEGPRRRATFAALALKKPLEIILRQAQDDFSLIDQTPRLF